MCLCFVANAHTLPGLTVRSNPGRGSSGRREQSGHRDDGGKRKYTRCGWSPSIIKRKPITPGNQKKKEDLRTDARAISNHHEAISYLAAIAFGDRERRSHLDLTSRHRKFLDTSRPVKHSSFVRYVPLGRVCWNRKAAVNLLKPKSLSTL